MKYKYSRKQLFGKKLKVPKDILKLVYGCSLRFEEFIRYELEDKVPISCLYFDDRQVVEKFGIEKAKTLDWELLNKSYFIKGQSGSFKDLALNIDSSIENVNDELYALALDKIKPRDYSSRMKELYASRFFEPSENAYINSKYEKFNDGDVSLIDLVHDWELFKDKDLSYCLVKDERNVNHITSSELKQFMMDFEKISKRILEHTDIYSFIRGYSDLTNEQERKEYVKKFTDEILSDTYRTYDNYSELIILSNEEYKEIFKYSSIEKYLKIFSEQNAHTIMKELETLPKDYVFESSIPFSVLMSQEVLKCIGVYGLKNIIDFDNECGHFFSRNDCEMLKVMSTTYLWEEVAYRVDSDKTIYAKTSNDANDNSIERPYTKDEFYEVMRRMIVDGLIIDADTTLDYRNIVGEFREKNEDLFISKQAPEELQTLFYTRKMTPQHIKEHPEYISYLKGKDLNNCFQTRNVSVMDNLSSLDQNFYDFLSDKANFNEVMDFLAEYSDVLDIVFASSMDLSTLHFSREDSLEKIKIRIHKFLKDKIVKSKSAYPENIPSSFKKEYPSLFLDENAPQELKAAVYSRTIDSDFILSNPMYREYLKNIDLNVLYPGMYIEVIKNGINYRNSFIETLCMNFEKEFCFDIMLLYGRYINQVYDINSLRDFKFDYSFSKEDVLNEIDSTISKAIFIDKMKYDEKLPEHFKKNNQALFLSKDAPQELKDALYNRYIDAQILSNPVYQEYLRKIDIEVLCPVVLISTHENGNYVHINLMNIIKQTFGIEDSFDIMQSYEKCVGSVFKVNQFKNFKYASNFSKENLLDEIDSNILEVILNGKMKYDGDFPIHFKNKNRNLFLSEKVSQEIRSKFYNRKLTIHDFFESNKLLDAIGETNVLFGFPLSYMWMYSFLEQMSNEERLKVIFEYEKIKDALLQKMFREYVTEFGIHLDNVKHVSEVLERLSLSNSKEMYVFRKELAQQILKMENPIKSLNKIEDIFIKNKIPSIGKIYACFEILHPDFEGFSFDEKSMVSPVLKKSSTMGRKIIAFSDLIKSSFGSNNRSMKEYMKNLENASNLYENIKLGQMKYDDVDECQKQELFIFSKYLETMYKSTLKGKKEIEVFESTQDVIVNIANLSKKLSPDGTLDYNLADRVVSMFCHFAGFDSLEETKNYIYTSINNADRRNRMAGSTDMTLEKGDFIKGIGDITYLGNILQNGSVSKEFLGFCATSDATPLDTDVSMILESGGTIEEKIGNTASRQYGPIWIALKNDGRFITTRTIEKTLDVKNDMSKMEVFYTGIQGEDHYGIRTGFASSEINYIIVDKYDERIGLEIAINGFYIPVANKEGRIVFTPSDYDKLREKMNGLSYFGEERYVFSENLITEEAKYFADQIEKNNYEVQVKREKINHVIKKSLDELGLQLKTNSDGDLTEGFVELIDTGSTGRGTNKPGDGDFDFMMRLDRTILSNTFKLNELKQVILRNLGKENSNQLTKIGDFRLKNVQIDADTNVDIDITFTKKTDKVSYSTDMALQDRLTTIQRTNPEKYKYVVANILLAKQILKEAEVYKPNRGEIPQGGLGGVGIENWILQNGGSLIDAARNFVEASEGKNFHDFKCDYHIWDFGENHLAERSGQYSHDNFVTSNMSEEGYNKMVQALKQYVNQYDDVQENTRKR